MIMQVARLGRTRMLVGILRHATMRAGLTLAAISAALLLLSTALSPSLHAETPANPADLSPLIRIDEALRGIVLGQDGLALRRVEGAHVGTGETSVRTDAVGRFHIPAGIRTNQLNVVAPGYEVVRSVTTAAYAVVFMCPLDVRAI